jgi:hypothetical protein
MVKKTLFLFLVISFQTWATAGILDRIISVDIKNTPIKLILKTIEERATVKFSYNPDFIDENKIVSISIQQKTIGYGLSLIFNKMVRFKEVGDHIVLLKNEDLLEMKERKKLHGLTKFTGIVRNLRTNKPIANASIYDVDSRLAAVSNQNGEYSITIPVAETMRSLYIRKSGFKEFVAVVDVKDKENIVLNVNLEPEVEIVEKIDLPTIEPIYQPVEDRILTKTITPIDVQTHNENLGLIKEGRIAQISLIPSIGIGSNLSTNGLMTNNFSLNVLAGYASGVNGVEIGGLVNLIKSEVRGVQIAGISNFVGDSVSGVQVGGISNVVGGDINGVQIAGIANFNGGEITGCQVGGIANFNHQNAKGVQVAGIFSSTKGFIDGMQISGICSAARGGFNGFQLAGIANLADSTTHGFQLAGIHNASFGNFSGGQVSGISNSITKGESRIQVAGIGNKTDVNTGLQVSGIFNFAIENKGVQVSLINTSLEGNGISIGLFNFVKNGYHKTELTFNETFPLNLTFKTGVRKFYNTYHLGARFGQNALYAVGLGFGSNLIIKNKFSFSADLSAQMVVDNDFENFNFSQLFKASTTLDFQVAKWMTLFVGPSFNVNLIQLLDNEGGYSSEIGFNPFYDQTFSNSRVKMWIGGQIGVRF